MKTIFGITNSNYIVTLEITPENLQLFVDRLFVETKVHSLVHGNLTIETALEFNDQLLAVLNSKPLTKLHFGHTVLLPKSKLH